MIVVGRDAELAKWAGDRLGIVDFGPCTAIGVEHQGNIVAVAIYHQFRHPNIEVSFVIASPRWASPGAVRFILSYPFVQLRCKRVTAITDATNKSARRFLDHLGFRLEGFHPDVFQNGDAVTYGMLAKDAGRWIGRQ